MKIDHTALEAAIAYARGKEEQYRHLNMNIFFQFIAIGIIWRMVMKSEHIWRGKQEIVTWEELARGQYDALKAAIDSLCVINVPHS